MTCLLNIFFVEKCPDGWRKFSVVLNVCTYKTKEYKGGMPLICPSCSLVTECKSPKGQLVMLYVTGPRPNLIWISACSGSNCSIFFYILSHTFRKTTSRHTQVKPHNRIRSPQCGCLLSDTLRLSPSFIVNAVLCLCTVVIPL